MVPGAKQLCSSSGFRIATRPPLIGGTTLEIPVTLSRKFPGPEKNCYSYRVSGLFGKFALSCVRTVTVFAVDFCHNPLTPLILNTESLVHGSRKRRAGAI
jgi:hypothetical protein